MHVTLAFPLIQHGLHEVAQLGRREPRAVDAADEAAISIGQRRVRRPGKAPAEELLMVSALAVECSGYARRSP
jgi:hypothetical protein